MNPNTRCERCTKIANDSQIFTCGHAFCSVCMIRIIFFTYLKEFSSQDQIVMTCMCKSGTKSFTVTKIYDLISNSINPSYACIMHGTEAKMYCVKCETWLCSKCLDIHIKMNPHHQLKKDQLDFVMCNEHQCHLQDLYCHVCKKYICPLCAIKGSLHYNHNYQFTEEYANSLRTQKTIEKQKDFSAYCSHFEQIAVQFKNNLQLRLDSTVESFNYIITQIEEMKMLSINKMKLTMEKADAMISLIRFIYSDFKKSINTNDISLLQDLAGLTKDIIGFELKDESQIKIKSILDKINELFEYYYNFEKIQPINVEWGDIEPMIGTYRSDYTSLAKDYTNVLTLTGHDTQVHCIIQLADGRIVSGSYQEIKVWEAREDSFINTLTLTGHSSSVRALLQLKDERMVSGSADKTIKIWEQKGKDFVNTLVLTGHDNWIYSVIQMNNNRLASASQDKTIKIWVVNKQDYKNPLTLIGHSSYVLSLIQMKDGRIASVSGDKTIKVWVISEKDYMNTLTLTGHNSYVSTIIQLKDGEIATGSYDNTIKLWRINETDFKNTFTITEHCNSVLSLILLKDGRIASGSEDKTIMIWEVSEKTLKRESTLNGHNHSILSLTQLQDGRIASGSLDKTIKIWKQF